MIEENPYAAGEARAIAPVEPDETVELLDSPTSRGAGAGFSWIGAGFSDFKRGPFAFVGFLVLIFVAGIVVSTIGNVGFLLDPALGFVVNMGTSFAMNLVLFVIAAGFLLAVRESRALGHVRFETFFAGFRHPRLGALLGLGGLYLLFTLIVTAGAFVALFFGMGPDAFGDFFASTWMTPYGSAGASTSWLADEDALLALAVTAAVAGSLVLVVIGMFFFFATHLVTFGDVGVLEAMKLSFLGCLKNILPLFFWSLAAVVLSTIGALLCGLGLLVAWPVLWASTYQAFLEIFTPEPADKLSGAPGDRPTI